MEQKILNQIAEQEGYTDWYELTEQNDPNTVHECTLKALKQALSIANVMKCVAASERLPERGDECWVQLNNGDIEMDLGDGDGFVNNSSNNVRYWWLIEKPEPHFS